MKRLLPLTLVALFVLVPAGFVWAAKAAKAKKSPETKAAHRSAKQKAANDKLVQELLTIMEETDNKMTFAACAQCLTLFKPAREVVIPAIIRKADKMGWLKADAKGEGNDEMAMIGEVLLSFLPHKQGRPSTPSAYTIQMPGPAYFGPPPLPPAAYSAPIYPNPQPCPYETVPASFPQPTFCPPPMPCPPPPPNWQPAARYSVPTTCPVATTVVSAPAAPADTLTAELLKILDETESKVTFALVVNSLYERGDSWDLVVPAVIRKADKMGWLKVSDKDVSEKLTHLVAEVSLLKAKQPEKVAAPSVSPGCGIIINGVFAAGPDERNEVYAVPFVDSGTVVGTGVGCGAGAKYGSVPRTTEYICMPHTAERVPMPHHKAELVPMPRAEE